MQGSLNDAPARRKPPFRSFGRPTLVDDQGFRLDPTPNDESGTGTPPSREEWLTAPACLDDLVASPAKVRPREASAANRIFDLVVIALLAPFVIPAAVVIALLVFLDSPGPILYRARRVGLDGRDFAMLKFRTMRHGAVGPAISASADHRYTPLGRFLARSRLDELPQLINVLRGDMRFVGPRPEDRAFVDAFADDYAVILSVPPGLTGPSAVEFAWEGEVLAEAEEHDRERLYRQEILPMKVVIDRAYATRQSIRSDVAIVARTCVLPFRHLALAAATPATGRFLVERAYSVAAVSCLFLLAIGVVIDGRSTI